MEGKMCVVHAFGSSFVLSCLLSYLLDPCCYEKLSNVFLNLGICICVSAHRRCFQVLCCLLHCEVVVFF